MKKGLMEYLYHLETRLPSFFYILCKYRFKYQSEKQFKSFQINRLKYIVEYAKKNSRFFNELYKGKDIEDPLSLPVVNKSLMMSNLTDYNCAGLTKEEILDFCLEVEESRDFTKRLKGYTIAMSSGTSGNKGVEIVSKEEENFMRAALLARFDLLKGEKMNVAFILRVSSPALNLNRFGHKVTYISLLDPIKKILSELNKLSPNVLAAPASMLKVLAQEKQLGNLDISPKRVVTYAEVMDPEEREFIGNVFGTMVHEIYKATEGPIGISCKHGNLHVNEDLVLLETLNLDGSITKPGEPSERLLVTDLHKRSQPIIRYELNDIVTISPDKCSCGSSYRVISRIQGRMDDLFWVQSVKDGNWEFLFPDQIRRAVIKSSEKIKDYMVTQEDPTHIIVYIVLMDGTDSSFFEENVLKKNLQSIFNKRELQVPNITIKYNDLKNNNSTKFIRIKRNFDHEYKK